MQCVITEILLVIYEHRCIGMFVCNCSLRSTIAYERAAASPMLCTVVRSAPQLHRTSVIPNTPSQTPSEICYGLPGITAAR